MTKLNGTKVARETATLYRGLPIIIELHSGYLTARQKGKQDTVTVDYSTILEVGYKLRALEKR